MTFKVSITMEFADAPSAVAFLQSYNGAGVVKVVKPKATKDATDSVPPAAALAAPAPSPEAAAPPAPSPEVPTFPAISKVNDAISKLAGVDRAGAVAILRKHGADKTPQLKPEVYQVVIDDAEEALARIDAAKVNMALV